MKKWRPVKELEKLDTPLLLDMLAEYTAKYTRLLTDRSSGEKFVDMTDKIRCIQSILDKRLRDEGPHSPESA